MATFGTIVPSRNAPLLEQVLDSGSAVLFRRLRHPVNNPEPGPGYVSANRGGFDRRALREHPFPEAYERGGGDGAWGHAQREAHQTVVYDPALSVQFFQGVKNPMDLHRLLHEYGQYGAPNKLVQE